MGTGSGVLAIAALVLGVERAVGIDLDGESVQEARRNAGRNRVARRLAIALAGPEAIADRFELVLANLTAPSLTLLASDLADRLSPRGVLVTSGFQAEEEDEVCDALAACDLRPDRARYDGAWSSLAFRPRGRTR